VKGIDGILWGFLSVFEILTDIFYDVPMKRVCLAQRFGITTEHETGNLT
jgi:hypothetical protein